MLGIETSIKIIKLYKFAPIFNLYPTLASDILYRELMQSMSRNANDCHIGSSMHS